MEWEDGRIFLKSFSYIGDILFYFFPILLLIKKTPKFPLINHLISKENKKFPMGVSIFSAANMAGRAGVMLFDLCERTRVQGNPLMMAHEKRDARRDVLMSSLNATNCATVAVQ